MPRVSVLLPVYNGSKYLKDAVDSILNQTFHDFELIAINDGSTDHSGDILETYHDARIKVIHQENIGLALTLNRAINIAEGEFIARQDQDDISLRERFTKQVDYLERNIRCGVVGTWSHIWDNQNPTNRFHQHPCENGFLQVFSLFDSYFVHSSVMARRFIVNEVGCYPTDPQLNPPEDFDLWSRMSKQCEFANLNEILIIYREIPGSISRDKAALIQNRVHRIACKNIADAIGGIANDYSDLVAIVRGCHTLLSKEPNWQHMQETLLQLRKYLTLKFPHDKQEIDHAILNLQERVRNNRSKVIVKLKKLIHSIIAFQ